MSRAWQLDDTRKLILMYKSHPELWDPEHEDYHNNVVKQKIFNGMARKMNKNHLEVKTKIRSLRSMYVREYKRVQAQIKKRGKYKGHVWFGYKMLSFLKPLYAAKKGDISVELDVKDDDQNNQMDSADEDTDDSTGSRICKQSNWTYEEVIQLMETYKNYPILWDPDHELYNNKHLRLKHIRELAIMFNKTAPELKTKLKNLRTIFHRTQQKIKNEFETKGKFTGKLWFGYKRMSYLDKEDHQFLIDDEIFDSGDDENTINIDEEDHCKEKNPWTLDECLKLIEMHKNHPELWDHANDDYHCRFSRRKALNKIANSLNRNRLEVDNKLRNLRKTFLRILRKTKSTKRKNLGKQWFGYEPMSYLKKNYENMFPDDDESDVDFDGSFDLIKHEVYSDKEAVSQSSMDEKYDYQPPTKVRKKKKTRKSSSKSDIEDPLLLSQKKHMKKEEEIKALESTNNQYPVTIDEFTVFGQFVSQELKNIKDDYALLMAKNEITNIIFKAQMKQTKRSTLSSE